MATVLRRLRQHYVLSAAVLCLLLVVGWFLGWEIATAIATRRSAQISRPTIILTREVIWQQRDPQRITTSDGRILHLAHVTAPAPESKYYEPALAQLQQTLRLQNLQVGLKVVGTADDSEQQVELWGLQKDAGGCGDSTRMERWRQSIPKWKRLEWSLLASGLYLWNVNSPDTDLRGWEDNAIDESRGQWADGSFLRAHRDLAPLDAMLDRKNDHHTNGERGRAASWLLRADPQKYGPKIFAMLTDPLEGDADFIMYVTYAFARAGPPAELERLVDAMRPGNPLGLSAERLDALAGHLGMAWNLPSPTTRDAAVQYYFSKPRRSGASTLPVH